MIMDFLKAAEALEADVKSIKAVTLVESRGSGYPTLQAFINAQFISEDGQMDTFVRFIKANPAIHLALKNKDWAKFAKLYNGPDYLKNKYDTKLAEAYASFK